VAWIEYTSGSGDDNIIRIHGIHPEAMRAHVALYREAMHAPGPLSRAQREMIGVVVSAINDCEY
jgi:alkylhydroperoxidase family enzyme